MPIAPRKASTATSPAASKAIDAFIEGAPDAKPKKASKLSKKTIVSLSIDVELLARLDERCSKLGITRAAAVAIGVNKLLSEN